MGESFYITLSSNADDKFHLDNKLTHFFNKLPNTLNFDRRKWEVGLVELQCPFNWRHFNKNEGYIDITTKNNESIRTHPVVERVRLPAGYYPDEKLLIDALNRQLIRVDRGSKKFRFRYKSLTKKCAVEFPYHSVSSFKLSPKLARVLGLKSTYGRKNGHQLDHGEGIIDVEDGLHNLYIYTNVVEHQVVGPTLSQLLRVIPVADEKSSKPTILTFQNIHYLPVRKQAYDSLEIDIRDVSGAPVSFQRGHILVTLHFRTDEK